MNNGGGGYVGLDLIKYFKHHQLKQWGAEHLLEPVPLDLALKYHNTRV